MHMRFAGIFLSSCCTRVRSPRRCRIHSLGVKNVMSDIGAVEAMSCRGEPIFGAKNPTMVYVREPD